jgi:small-conductance mechanosensitive channel
MLSNNLIIVPNAKLAQATIVNFSKPSREFGFSVEMGVAYGSDLARVEAVTLEVAREVLRDVPGAALDADPSIRFTMFGDSSVRLSVNLRGKEYADQHLLKHEFMKRVHVRYQREGIVMPYPQRTVTFDESARELFTRGA